jgi:hypothetical protein
MYIIYGPKKKKSGKMKTRQSVRAVYLTKLTPATFECCKYTYVGVDFYDMFCDFLMSWV